MTENAVPGGRFVAVGDGDWAGWSTWAPGDPYEDHVGPFYARRDDAGVLCGFLPAAHHRNGSGAIHGGALMSFADFALFAIAGGGEQGVHGVTVAFTAEFLAAVRPATLLTARGEVLRGGRSLIFVRGTMEQDGVTVFAFSGTLKRVR